MKSKLVGEQALERIFVLILDSGEEAFAAIMEFAVHLLEATVRPTVEATVVKTPVHLRRKTCPDLGIALISLP
jgi:predicted DNA-binding protein with PD1-like motif